VNGMPPLSRFALTAVSRLARCLCCARVQGGVLLLGASIWIDGTYPERGPYCGGWRLVQADISRAKRATGMYPLCFNVHTKTFGSFGVIYHRNVFEV